MENLVVSNELINIKGKREIGILFEEIVQRCLDRKLVGKSAIPTMDDLKEMSDLTKRFFKNKSIPFHITFNPHPNAIARVLRMPNVGGTSYSGKDDKNRPSINHEKLEQLLSITVDLEKPAVYGNWPKEVIDNEITLTTGLFTGEILDFTAEEIVSVIMHEIGHIFNQYLVLGDSAWIGYILQDGIEILSGQKANKFKLDILTPKALAKMVEGDDPKLAKELMSEASEEHYRRALLMAIPKLPRHQFSSKGMEASYNREEQLADIFASRMGYARASVTFAAKTDKKYGTMETYRGAALHRNDNIRLFVSVALLFGIGTFSIIALPVMSPLVALGLSMHAFKVIYNAAPDYRITTYDQSMERQLKFRRDLVQQLKVLYKNTDQEKQIVDDIAICDDIISQYRNNRSVLEKAFIVFSPERRRQRDLFEMEQMLERLFNNDLYVAASRFNQLKGKTV